MKSTIKNALLLFSGLALLSSSAMAAVTYTNGDLLLGFRQAGGSNTYVFNLGSSFDYRNNGTVPGVIANINADLTAAFGDWKNDTSISFGIIGNHSNTPLIGTGGVVNGDPRQTIYASVGTTIPGASAPLTLAGNTGPISTKIQSFAKGAENSFANSTETTGSGGRGAIIATGGSSNNTWEDYNSDSGGFDLGNIEQTISGVEGASHSLDLYRLLATNNGANPTGIVGTGSYETTFTLDSLGNITATNAIPEPSSILLIGFGAVAGAVRRRRSEA